MKISKATQRKIDELRRLAAVPYAKPQSPERMIYESCCIAFRAAHPDTRHKRKVQAIVSAFRKAMRPPDRTEAEG